MSKQGSAVAAQVIEAIPDERPVVIVRGGVYVTDDAARFLKLSPRTLEKYRVNGGGPRHCKLNRGGGRGGAVRYMGDDLLDYVRECRRHSTSDVGTADQTAAGSLPAQAARNSKAGR